MIDLRCHLFEAAEGAEMCALAAAEGVREAVAAVRWAAERGGPPVGFEEYGRRLEELRAGGASPRLRTGFVLEYGPHLPALIELHGPRLALGGGPNLLVAAPSLRAPEGAEEMWGELGGRGFGVVVARPECSAALRADAERLGRWVSGGVSLQLDAASITGAHGREARRFALACLEAYWSTGRVVVASNARDAGPRRPSLRAASEEVARRLGRRAARVVTSDAPARLLDPESAPHEPASAGLRAALSVFVRALRAKTLTNES